jgi:hypothetical protein
MREILVLINNDHSKMEKNKNQKFKLIHRRPLKLEKVPPHDQVFT